MQADVATTSAPAPPRAVHSRGRRELNEGATMFAGGGEMHRAHLVHVTPIRQLSGRDERAQRVAPSPTHAGTARDMLGRHGER